MRQRYIISKHTHTSILDTNDIPPKERETILDFIQEEMEAKEKQIQEMEQKLNSRGK